MENALLGRLPAELRLQIYELALAPSLDNCNDCIDIQTRRKVDDAGDVVFEYKALHASGQTQALALSKTCRTIHREARGLFFSAHTFRFLDEWSFIDQPFDVLEGFAELIGVSAASGLRDVLVDVVGGHDLCACSGCEKCEVSLRELVKLRQWAAKNPRTRVSANFLWPAECATAIVDVSGSKPPVVRDGNAFLERHKGGILRIKGVLEQWQQVLQEVEVDKLG